MSVYVEKARELRAIVSPHYNCAQSVVLPFCADAGIPEETAMRFASGFGGGMKRGGICGAVSGGVMALGLFGIDDPARLGRFYKAFLEKQNGLLECADLVRAVTSKGLPKKPHCDAMVLFAVQTVETILKEEGKLPSREE